MFADLLRFGEDGKINLFDDTAFLLPSKYILKIEEQIAPDEIYELAKKIPLPIMRMLSDRKMRGLERLDFLLELAEVFGMGRIEVPDFDQNKKTHEVIITNISSNKISCHHTRGYLASIFSDSLNRNFECDEKECISKGDKTCRFILSSGDLSNSKFR